MIASNFEGAKKVVRKLAVADYTYPSYKKRFEVAFADLTTGQIIEKSSSTGEAVLMLVFQSDAEIDVATLRTFLQSAADKLSSEPYISQYRKLVCRYDRLVYGFALTLG